MLRGACWSSGSVALVAALMGGESEQPVEELAQLIGEAMRAADEAEQLEVLQALVGAAPRGGRARALSSERAVRAACERFGELLGELGLASLARRPRVSLAVARLLRGHPDLGRRELYPQIAPAALEAILASLHDDEARAASLRLGAAGLMRPLPMAQVVALCADEGALDEENATALAAALVERRPGLAEEQAYAEQDLALLERLWWVARADARARALGQLRDRIELERSHKDGQMHRGSLAPALSALDAAQRDRLRALLCASLEGDAQQERALVLQLSLVAGLPVEPRQALLLLSAPNAAARAVALRALQGCADASCGDGLLALRRRLPAGEREEVDRLLVGLGRDPEEQLGHVGGLSVSGDGGDMGALELVHGQLGALSEPGEGGALALAPGVTALSVEQRAWLSVAPPPRAISPGLLLSLMVLGTHGWRVWAWPLAFFVLWSGWVLGGGAAIIGLMMMLTCVWLVLSAVTWTSTLVQSLRGAPVQLMPLVQLHRSWRGKVAEVQSDRGRHMLRLPLGEGRGLEPGELIPVMWSHRDTLCSPLQIKGVAIREDGRLVANRMQVTQAALVATLAILFVAFGFSALVGMMMTPTPPVVAPF